MIWGPGERDIILKVLVLQDLEIPYLFMGHFPCRRNRNSVQNTTARAATVAFPCSEAISSRSLCPRSQNWLRSRKEDKERDFLFGDITLRSWLSALDCTVGQVEQEAAGHPSTSPLETSCFINSNTLAGPALLRPPDLVAHHCTYLFLMMKHYHPLQPLTFCRVNQNPFLEIMART